MHSNFIVELIKGRKESEGNFEIIVEKHQRDISQGGSGTHHFIVQSSQGATRSNPMEGTLSGYTFAEPRAVVRFSQTEGVKKSRNLSPEFGARKTPS